MGRATTEETTSRIDQLQGLLLAGEPNTACLEFATAVGYLKGTGLQAPETSMGSDQGRRR